MRNYSLTLGYVEVVGYDATPLGTFPGNVPSTFSSFRTTRKTILNCQSSKIKSTEFESQPAFLANQLKELQVLMLVQIHWTLSHNTEMDNFNQYKHANQDSTPDIVKVVWFPTRKGWFKDK